MDNQTEISNFQVIQQLINAMLGGAMLILPILFNQGGIVLSFLVLALSGLICYQTCYLFLSHIKHSEIDVQDLIRRILGENWYKLYVFLSSFYLFLLSVLYYLLLTDISFSVCQFILEVNDIDQKNIMGIKSEMNLDKFGIFWISLILLIPITFMIFMKDLKKINKITEYGVYCIYAFVIFIIFVFCDNLAQHRLQDHIDKVNLFTWDIGHLAGTCSLAFNMHTCMIAILRQQKSPQQQNNNLRIAYFIGFLIYFTIGALGGLGIIGRPRQVKSPQSITDFFGTKEISPLIIELLYFVNLITVLPCFFNIFRDRILSFIYQSKEIPKQAPNFINILYLSVALLVTNTPSIKAGDLMSANGAISCFFIVYVIPIMIHFQCFYGEQKCIVHNHENYKNQVSLNYYEEDLDKDINIIESNYIKKKVTLDIEEELIISKQDSCNDHHDIDKYPIYFRALMYGTMLLIGTAVFVYGIYNIFFRKDEPLSMDNTLKDPEQKIYLDDY